MGSSIYGIYFFYDIGGHLGRIKKAQIGETMDGICGNI